MDSFNQIKKLILLKVKDGEPVYWDLYISNSNQVQKRADKAASNYELDNIDDSLTALQQAMEVLKHSGMKYFILKLKSSQTAPHAHTFPVPNDAYRGFLPSPSIGAVSNQNANDSRIFELQQQLFETRMQHIKELHEIEMQRLRDDIQGAMDHKSTMIEKIIENAQKPAFAPLIGALTAKLLGSPLPAAVASVNAPAAIEQDVNQSTDHSDHLQVQQNQQQQMNIMEDCINKIESVFPGETLVFLQELSTYVQMHPVQAQQVRVMLKNSDQNAAE